MPFTPKKKTPFMNERTFYNLNILQENEFILLENSYNVRTSLLENPSLSVIL